GERGLARELYQAAIERNDGSHLLHTALSAAWARFLIEERDFPAAEVFLLRQHWTLPADSAALIFELYQAWDRLEHLRAELPKYHLPRGIEKEVLFNAWQAVKTESLSPVLSD
ncbi:MAG TPA: hypothetical protein DIT64_07865, partial [Verrucomicrobiales bacterium]|nr:hypothetical protein [Verrucomicrobiales bacterium]